MINILDLEQLTLASGGTRQEVSASQLNVEGAIFTAPSTNLGNVFIGSVSCSSTRYVLILEPGQSKAISVNVSEQSDSSFINLKNIYWDGTTGDKLNVGYMIRG